MNFDLPPTAELDQVETSVEGPAPGIAVPEPEDLKAFTEARLMWLSKAAMNGPTFILNELPTVPTAEKPEDDLITNVNAEFYQYCLRKDINPFDYVFDELPLLIAILPIALFHWKNYQEIYGKDKKEIDKLDKDYENAKTIDDEVEGE